MDDSRNCGVQLLVRNDSVDEADRQRFLSTDGLTRQDQPLRQAGPDASWRSLRSAQPWIDADTSLRKGKRRFGCGDDGVTGERELDAAAERQAVQSGDYGLRASLDRSQQR